MATVTFAQASRIYPGSAHPAVDSLDLEIFDGEFLVLVGPSGCGKSTTLRMVAGLEPVDTGTVYIGDTDVTMLPPRERDIAMVFQSYALYPHMTVAENIGFHLKIKHLPKAEIDERVREAVRAGLHLAVRVGVVAVVEAALGRAALLDVPVEEVPGHVEPLRELQGPAHEAPSSGSRSFR